MDFNNEALISEKYITLIKAKNNTTLLDNYEMFVNDIEGVQLI